MSNRFLFERSLPDSEDENDDRANSLEQLERRARERLREQHERGQNERRGRERLRELRERLREDHERELGERVREDHERELRERIRREDHERELEREDREREQRERREREFERRERVQLQQHEPEPILDEYEEYEENVPHHSSDSEQSDHEDQNERFEHMFLEYEPPSDSEDGDDEDQDVIVNDGEVLYLENAEEGPSRSESPEIIENDLASHSVTELRENDGESIVRSSTDNLLGQHAPGQREAGDLQGQNSPRSSDLQGQSTSGPSDLQGQGLPGSSDLQGQSLPGPSGLQGQSSPRPNDLQGQSSPGPSDLQGQSSLGPSDPQGQSSPGPSDIQGQSLPGPSDLQGQSSPGASDLQEQSPPGPSGIQDQNRPQTGKIQREEITESDATDEGKPLPDSQATGTSISDNERKRKAEHLDWMECPVCLETPRGGPLYSCRQGHILCKDCKPKVEHCPTCRDAHIDCRNLIAEKLLLTALENYQLKCKHSLYGCTRKDTVTNLELHESNDCVYRTVPCPDKIVKRRDCDWEGPLCELFEHVEKKGVCARVVNEAGSSVSHFTMLLNMPRNYLTITGTVSRAVLLISKESPLKDVCFFSLSRNNCGYWCLYVRTYAQSKESLRVKIWITEKEYKNLTDDRDQFLYTGAVSSFTDSEEVMKQKGQFMLLQDTQIKKLMGDSNMIAFKFRLFYKD